MFQDVDVKIQVQTYLNFEVNVLKHAFFPIPSYFVLITFKVRSSFVVKDRLHQLHDNVTYFNSNATFFQV